MEMMVMMGRGILDLAGTIRRHRGNYWSLRLGYAEARELKFWHLG
jgi:hypothetical protein